MSSALISKRKEKKVSVASLSNANLFKELEKSGNKKAAAKVRKEIQKRGITVEAKAA